MHVISVEGLGGGRIETPTDYGTVRIGPSRGSNSRGNHLNPKYTAEYHDEYSDEDSGTGKLCIIGLYME